ncbi:DUF7824 domain-containing protein [Cellulomonas biazotea]|uniref:DUF7824 domain-containing protein n=2 Tax=Cellulomonas biazotea TaxID=1709 RepID=UPI0035E67A91
MTAPRLAAALQVFTDLGWGSADLADVEHLPLGTPEQQRTARDGLASGAWGAFGQTGPNTYGWISAVPVDETLLAVLAVRAGVDVRRAVRLLASAHRVDDELATRLVAARGERFAVRFVEEASRTDQRAWEHATSRHAGVLVRLVDRFDLPVPDSVAYLKDWAVYAHGELTGTGEPGYERRMPLAPEVLERRAREHVRAAVAAGVPGTGPFGTVLPAAVARGWVDRDEAVDLVVAALDAAQRPGDRKVWTQVLTGPLALTDDELVARADTFVPVLAHGDGPVVEALAPRLVAHAPDEVLGDVLAVTLLVRTKKVLRLLLVAASDRPRPSDAVVETVGPLVALHTASPDRALARAAGALAAAWGIAPDDADVGAEDPVAGGAWQPAPPAWDVPRFDAGDVSAGALTAAAALLTGRPDGVVDVEVERFLALANAVAGQDREAARSALGGVRSSWVAGLRCVHEWVRGEPLPLLDRRAGRDSSGWDQRALVWGPVDAREAAVLQRLGEVPVLLSTPSWVDLRVDPADLADRLTAYAAAGAAASEADLFLALTRLDVARATDDVRAALDALPVPVVLQDGSRASVTAGPTARRYLDDPVREPGLRVEGTWRHWTPEAFDVPRSLAALPARLGVRTYDHPGIETFPSWGDAASSGIGASDASSSGLVLRQLARRATPLTPGLAVNLLGAQRGFHPAAAADGSTAVHEAWERGLLRPGVPDVQLLDWAETPSNLASLARACGDLASEGLLAVVWPVLDDLLLASLRAPRMLAGTAEVAETQQRLLAAVLAAVAAGDATPDALDLPGARALAARAGSSRAVVAARAVVALLPADPAPAVVAPALEPPTRAFLEIWPPGAGTRPAVEDGATLVARWVDPDVPRKMLAVDLTLPDRPDATYRVVKAWFYDLEHEGQCAALSDAGVRAGTRGLDAWLRWDDAAGRLVVGAQRDWRGGTDGPLSGGGPVPPLTTSMVAALLASLCHDDPETYHPREILHEGLVGSAAVAVAVRALVTQPDVSPARMVRLLESHPTTLPVLWPVLVESVRHAAAVDGAPPRWLNRVLDVALLHAAHLREAADRGLLPTEAAAWPGLAALAARPGSSAVLRKARDLAARLLTDGS